MSMNKFMHPRNRYRREKPDFAQLAIDYPQFAEASERDERGRVTLNFKLPHHLAALTRALLAKDFHLQVEIPLDRLIPTLPLRLNYVHWLEDILGCETADLRGIDVGTGSCCIYPLLAVRCHPTWSFVATEVDKRNAAYAEENVLRNGLQERIRVMLAPPNSGPLAFPMTTSSQEAPQFDFCMCNPPFFADAAEAQGLINTRSANRPPPMSASTAASVESFSSGGEVLFVTRIAQESARYKDRCRLFTSMLGRKPSLKPLKRLLSRLGVASYGTYEFCQGRVMRWGLGWTFNDNLKFPMSEFKRRKLQSRPPLTLELPQKHADTNGPDADYNLDAIYEWCKRTLRRQLRVDCWDQLLKQGSTGRRMRVSAKEVTWTRQRHRRRHPSKEATSQVDVTQSKAGISKKDDTSIVCQDVKQLIATDSNALVSGDLDEQSEAADCPPPPEKRPRLETSATASETAAGASATASETAAGASATAFETAAGASATASETAAGASATASETAARASATAFETAAGASATAFETAAGASATEFETAAGASATTACSPSKSSTKDNPPVLLANLSLDFNSQGVIELQLAWLDGHGREVMHQLLLYLRNQYTSGTDDSSDEEADKVKKKA